MKEQTLVFVSQSMQYAILYPREIQNVEDLYERPDTIVRAFCNAESIREEDEE